MKLNKILMHELKMQNYNLEDYEMDDEVNVSMLKKYDLPRQKDNIDWTPVRQICGQYIKRIYNNERLVECKAAVWQELFETMYGENIWEFMDRKKGE